jgi:hypothetical protein
VITKKKLQVTKLISRYLEDGAHALLVYCNIAAMDGDGHSPWRQRNLRWKILDHQWPTQDSLFWFNPLSSQHS